MSKKNVNLDEMQEQKLLKIEHNGVWLAFWGLILSILVQFVMGFGDQNLLLNIVGEVAVLTILAVYMEYSFTKNGIWDRKFSPNLKTNLVLSLVSSTVCAAVFFTATYLKYHKLAGSVATGIFIFGMMFVFIFGALSISMILYKKRVAKLEREAEGDK